MSWRYGIVTFCGCITCMILGHYLQEPEWFITPVFIGFLVSTFTVFTLDN